MSQRSRVLLCATALLIAPIAGLAAQSEPVDLATLARIRQEGLQRSQVMDHISWLADVYGPRLTGSPAMEQAASWAMQKMREWGLANVHQERFAFGKGWSLVRFSAHMIEPQVQPLIGLPKSWTRGTDGPVIAEVVRPVIETEADFEKYRGRLRGRIVLTQPARDVRMLEGRLVLRMNEQDMREALTEPPPPPQRGAGAGGGGQRGGGQRGGGGPSLQQRIQQFWIDEGVLGLLDRGSDSDASAGGSDLSWQTQRTDGGTIFVGSGGARDSTAGRGLPSITLAVEHYNRMVRILDRGVPVKMELDVRTQFHDETQPNAFNLVGEIPGTDPALREEVVMIGAHFDSHHGGTGATDNASGSSAMLETMRILQAVGARPRRTIRIALWGAEEQGLLGSREYVRRHFMDAGGQPLPEHARLSAYFNIDNGTGRIRGIWMERNAAVRPIFARWIEPLQDLGVELLGPRAVGSTDHASLDAAGLPAFQFIQERYEYNSRTHHSNMDVVDRVQAEDMKQMAVVVASFAWLAAQRDEMLPRKPAGTR
jgi:hypothetical protein